MTPFYADPMVTLYQGDVRDVLRELPAESVQTVVTSPPYWSLRDYGIEPSVWGGDAECGHEWGEADPEPRPPITERPDLDPAYAPAGWSTRNATAGPGGGSTCLRCGAWRGALGLEPTPEMFIAHMVEVFREVKRVLRRDGTCWVNIGDSYAANRSYQVRDNKHTNVGNEGGMTVPPGLKPKDLVGIPWMLAFALRADGWWLRQDIIWAKPNPMPESVTDRCTKAHEYVFLLTKAERYYFDADAIRESNGQEATWEEWQNASGRHAPSGNMVAGVNAGFGSKPESFTHPAGRNKRSVWTIATEPFPEAHFATFPQALVKPCILAGTSERGACAQCGAPWARVTEPTPEYADKLARLRASEAGSTQRRKEAIGIGVALGAKDEGGSKATVTTGWRPTCAHTDAPTVPCTVLDPFSGSGTTALVAKALGRRAVGIDLNAEYLAMARKRIERVTLPMMLEAP